MKDPNIKTKVAHSRTKCAWNVVCETLGGKHMVARVPYCASNNKEATAIMRTEAFEHAEFISFCFNNSASILSNKEVSS